MIGYSHFFLFLALVLGSSAQSSLATLAGSLPSCALTCLESSLEASICLPTNITCICEDAALQLNVTLCVSKTCTIKQELTTKNATQTMCEAPIRDRRPSYRILTTFFGCLSGGVLGLRLISKFVSRQSFWLDDYFIVAAFFSGIPSSVIVGRMLPDNGLGTDIWTVPFNNITTFSHIFYVTELLYFLQIALLKLSLLFFYLRIFPGAGIRRVIWGTIGFDILFGLVFIFVGIFQCQPISYYWTSWDGEHEGKCYNANAMGYANAGISIMLDIWMLGLPLSQLLTLQMHWKKKIGVGLMFSVGTFVTVVSAIRLQYLITFAYSANATWDNYGTALWSDIEINVGIVCACMPSIRILLLRLFPKILGSGRANTHPSNKYYNVSRSRAGTGPRLDVSVGENDSQRILYEQSYTVESQKRETSDGGMEMGLQDLELVERPSNTRASIMPTIDIPPL